MSVEKSDSVHILVAEDDDDDYLLTEEAFKSLFKINPLIRVKDGEELMEYLSNAMEPHPSGNGMPSLILLDLNMPRKDGREALEEIKSNRLFRKIPIIILTTSQAEEDVVRSYDLGVNSFIRKPVTFEEFKRMLNVVYKYWLEVVELPDQNFNMLR